MRVLHVHTRYRQPGGEDAVVAAERNVLAAAGHQVAAFDLSNPTDPVGAAARLAAAPWNERAASSVVAAAQDHRAEVVHLHNTWYSLSPAAFTRLHQAGFPTVATFHNYRLVCANAMLFRDGAPCELCVGRDPSPGVRYRCYRDSVVASAAVATTITVHRSLGTWSRHLGAGVALTEFARSRLVLGGLREDRLLVKPNFVDDPGERLGPAADADEILLVGRLAPEKGVDLLLEAWNRACPEGLRLVVIGDGPERTRLEAMAGPDVDLVGRLDPAEVRHRMRHARALVLASRWYEGQPMVLLEALSAGLPTAVTNLGALPETVGEGGITFDPAPDSLASALGELSDDRLIDKLSGAARNLFEERYHARDAAARLVEVYEQAIANT